MLRNVVLAGALTICVLAQTAAAETRDTSYWSDAGYGTLAAFSTLFYMPVKLVYAGLGLFTGSLAYVCTAGDSDTAQKVWSPSLGGSYVVSASMLRGDEPILFNGPSFAAD